MQWLESPQHQAAQVCHHNVCLLVLSCQQGMMDSEFCPKLVSFWSQTHRSFGLAVDVSIGSFGHRCVVGPVVGVPFRRVLCSGLVRRQTGSCVARLRARNSKDKVSKSARVVACIPVRASRRHSMDFSDPLGSSVFTWGSPRSNQPANKGEGLFCPDGSPLSGKGAIYHVSCSGFPLVESE